MCILFIIEGGMRPMHGKSFIDKRLKYFVIDKDGCKPVKEKLRELIKSGEVEPPKSNFTTDDAIRILKELGFKVFRIEEV